MFQSFATAMFLKCSPVTAASVSPGILSAMQIFGPHHGPTELETLGMRIVTCFNELPRRVRCTAKFANHCRRTVSWEGGACIGGRYIHLSKAMVSTYTPTHHYMSLYCLTSLPTLHILRIFNFPAHPVCTKWYLL